MENLYAVIGERIKEKRKEVGINQQALAEEIKISRTSISNIEKGRHQPTLHLLFKICYALNLDIKSVIPSIEELQNFNNGKMTSFSKILNEDNSLSENSITQIETVLKNLK